MERSSELREARVALRMNWAQIIGVTDREITVETAMAKTIVIENSRNSRPTIPPMNKSGMNAAMSEWLMESTVNQICLEPSSAAWSGVRPLSRLLKAISIMTMASSTTKLTDTTRAMSDRLSIEKPRSQIATHVPASESGTVIPA